MAQITNPQQLFGYKLGTALGMERKVLTMLKLMQSTATMPELQQGFERHLQETEQQIANIEQALQAIGESGGHEDAIADGMAQQMDTLLERVDEGLVDAVLVGGATHTEHHEIATYEGLITMASQMGEDDVVALLQENLEQEQNMLQETTRATETLAQQLAQVGT